MHDFSRDGWADLLVVGRVHVHQAFWYENPEGQVKENGQITFREHKIMGDRSEEFQYGAAFSQPHALDLADIDGDGLKDILVGKRLWAHGPKGDIEPDAAPVLYWFQLTRSPNGQVRYVPHRVDDASGVGTQVVAANVTGDGRPDLLTVSKLGAFVFINREAKQSAVGRTKFSACKFAILGSENLPIGRRSFYPKPNPCRR